MTEAAAPRTLVLVRHGQTAWNYLGRAQGHIDVELDETGHGQASSVAPTLAAMRPSRLWTSDLTRARQSMAYVEKRTGLVATPDPRLREFDLGVRSGLTIPEFAQRFPEEHAAWLRDDESLLVRGSESTVQVRARLAAVLTECLDELAPGETGIVMMHGASGMVGIAALLGWSDDARRHLRGMDNCGWAVLAEHPHKGGLRLAAYNVTGGRQFTGTEPAGVDFASGTDAR
ncbi:histidine phosphatase family protein [Nocardioides rotundus]|uniref:histidine phosphatase family protein n=1 Tax=Nocardioides rotundus TaxID=1774216 RepID=UPI001CBE97C7|nr:histidine phosphatase family protein [Nocardioides rotundus]UAL28382.1 histidine phosphatase family protein [Nocardioides rotundus]